MFPGDNVDLNISDEVVGEQMSVGVVLVHGSGMTSACWEPLLPLLQTPAIAVDLPGRGRRPADLLSGRGQRLRRRRRRRHRVKRLGPGRAGRSFAGRPDAASSTGVGSWADRPTRFRQLCPAPTWIQRGGRSRSLTSGVHAQRGAQRRWRQRGTGPGDGYCAVLQRLERRRDRVDADADGSRGVERLAGTQRPVVPAERPPPNVGPSASRCGSTRSTRRTNTSRIWGAPTWSISTVDTWPCSATRLPLRRSSTTPRGPSPRT